MANVQRSSHRTMAPCSSCGDGVVVPMPSAAAAAARTRLRRGTVLPNQHQSGLSESHAVLAFHPSWARRHELLCGALLRRAYPIQANVRDDRPARAVQRRERARGRQTHRRTRCAHCASAQVAYRADFHSAQVTVRKITPTDMIVNLHSVPISSWDAFTLQYLAWDPKLVGDPVDQGIFRGESTVDYEGGRVQTLEVHFPVPFSGG